MNGTESSVATPPQTDWMRHGLSLCLLGLGLFTALGLAGLVLQEVAEGVSAPDVPPASEVAQSASGREPVVLAWTAPELEDGALSAAPVPAQPVTPLVLIAGSLMAFELSGGASDWLILEPDGTLRTESEGALVGFLHDAAPLELGDSIAGPGLMSIQLLHLDSWVSEDALVPIVESDGSGGWIVTGHRRFGIEASREAQDAREAELGEPALHPRTGLPTVLLASRRG